MTDTPEFESKPEYIRRMADDGLGGLGDILSIEAAVSASFAELGTVTTDVEDIPISASVRANGVFTDADDMGTYLENGGLVVTDEFGNREPMSFIWVHKYYDDVLLQNVYQVYIDENT